VHRDMHRELLAQLGVTMWAQVADKSRERETE
jgi:hypothetical protein